LAQTSGNRRGKRPAASSAAPRAVAPRQPIAPATAAAGAFPVIGIGASAGGLEAFRKLLEALPADTGIAFVLVPHLEPTHASMMVDLLGLHTAMTVMQVTDGMLVERNHVYIIPPQAYLAVRDGRLRLSRPEAPHGARLPFDFFLHSLADEYGERAVAVILSGTGADGSIGLKAVSDRGGLVIAQEPEEAAYDGMPRNAIATGAVNLVLPVVQIPQALIRYAHHPYVTATPPAVPSGEDEDHALLEIIELLRSRTSRNFTHYRRPTLLRRIRRRMAAAGIQDVADYITALRQDGREVELLAKDFLIHVTSFFRDPAAFEGLAKTIVPLLVSCAAQQPIRVWVPACSTGEEAYSLGMLFLEEFARQKRSARLQIFASDISEEALGFAREGRYPEAIKGDVSPERLQQFFTLDDGNYLVSRQLRDLIVFTVHDLLVDPPFSRLDLISCRNLLIYLQPEEQQKVLSLFHFGLNEVGYLFLGVSETIGQLGGLFEPISNTLRVYRRVGVAIGRARTVPTDLGERARALWPRLPEHVLRRAPSLGDIAQQQLLDLYAPATVLVDRNYRALYFSGPTDLYLRVAPGEPSQDLLPMLRDGLRSRFRTAARQASREKTAVTVGGARVRRNGGEVSVRISARPMQHDGDELLLISFADESERKPAEATETPAETSRVAQLEQELEDTRKELESTIRELEESNQELSAMNEEALSINEEFQSTNEELETSREELQSLNEELATTNNQLQETLERQRNTADDLQNILNSSDPATLFLDESLNIRYFTPSAAPLFNVIPSDLGRPLGDLAIRFTGVDLIADARTVLDKLTPLRREVRSQAGVWYLSVISPYRTRDNRIQGVVITLGNISELKAEEEETRQARAYAEAVIDTVREPLVVFDDGLRVVSASRSFYLFFGATPEDTIGGLLPDTDAHHLDVPALRAFLDEVKDREAPQTCEIEIDLPPPLGRRTLVVTAGEIRDAGAADRRTLLTFNDITDYRHSEQQLAAAREAAEQANQLKSRFLAAVSHDLRQPLQTLTMLLGVLRDEAGGERAGELASRAQEAVDSMSGLLNALLDIDQLETGAIRPQPIDFPINDLLGRLDSEYGRQARTQGLDWRYVPSSLAVRSDPRLLEQMLRNLLSNAIRYTEKGKILLGCRRRGSMLRIEVWDTGIGIAEADISRIFGEYERAGNAAAKGSHGLGLAIVQRLGDLLGHAVHARSQLAKGSLFSIEVPLAAAPTGRGGWSGGRPLPVDRPSGGAVLLIEDDPAVRRSLERMLRSAGYGVVAAASGAEALALLGDGVRPDLILSDYFLRSAMDGTQAVTAVRGALGRQLPAILLTGDIRRRDIALPDSVVLTKPVTPADLLRAILKQLAAAPPATVTPDVNGAPSTIFVVDDERGVRDAMRELLTAAGYRVETFASGQALLDADRAVARGCLLIDVHLPAMSGFDLLARLAAAGNPLPAVLITGYGDVAMAVEAMRAGAIDFIEKPVHSKQLLAAVERALQHTAVPGGLSSWRAAAAMRIATLTRREREVMDEVVAGRLNKEIAQRLAISQRTVETHRAKVMQKMGAASLSDLVRLALAAQTSR
jgi:two-component system, chemotaxis family, CheB/CheR fusion protein